jgi:hypothetical protein
MESVTPYHPPGLHLVTSVGALDVGQHSVGTGCQPNQPRRSAHRAAVLVKIVGENGLGGLLGQAKVEPVYAAASRQIHRPEHLASGVDFDCSLSAPGVEKSIDETQRLENLERARMYHRRSVPVEWRWSGIDQMTRHTAPLQLRSEEQPRRPGPDDEHGGIAVYPLWIAGLRHRLGTVAGIRHYSSCLCEPASTGRALVRAAFGQGIQARD